MGNHTPGPWIACDNNGYSIWRVTSPEYRAESASRTVAEVVGDSAETEANARLIAAAPEMLELLTRVATSTNSGYGSMMSAATLADTLRDLSSQAKQLMSKIERGGDE